MSTQSLGTGAKIPQSATSLAGQSIGNSTDTEKKKKVPTRTVSFGARVGPDQAETIGALWETHQIYHQGLKEIILFLNKVRQGKDTEYTKDLTPEQKQELAAYVYCMIRGGAQGSRDFFVKATIKSSKDGSLRKLIAKIRDGAKKQFGKDSERFADTSMKCETALSLLDKLKGNPPYHPFKAFREEMERMLPRPFCWMALSSAVARILGHQTQMEGWHSSHNEWLAQKNTFEAANAEYTNALGCFAGGVSKEVWLKSIQGKLLWFEETFDSNKGLYCNQLVRFLESNPELLKWRGSTDQYRPITDAQRRELQSITDPAKRSVKLLAITKDNNPELGELLKTHKIWKKRFYRPASKKRHMDGFDHPPTFTLPDPLLHPAWMVLSGPQSTSLKGYEQFSAKKHRRTSSGGFSAHGLARKREASLVLEKVTKSAGGKVPDGAMQYRVKKAKCNEGSLLYVQEGDIVQLTKQGNSATTCILTGPDGGRHTVICQPGYQFGGGSIAVDKFDELASSPQPTRADVFFKGHPILGRLKPQDKPGHFTYIDDKAPPHNAILGGAKIAFPELREEGTKEPTFARISFAVSIEVQGSKLPPFPEFLKHPDGKGSFVKEAVDGDMVAFFIGPDMVYGVLGKIAEPGKASIKQPLYVQFPPDGSLADIQRHRESLAEKAKASGQRGRRFHGFAGGLRDHIPNSRTDLARKVASAMVHTALQAGARYIIVPDKAILIPKSNPGRYQDGPLYSAFHREVIACLKEKCLVEGIRLLGRSPFGITEVDGDTGELLLERDFSSEIPKHVTCHSGQTGFEENAAKNLLRALANSGWTNAVRAAQEEERKDKKKGGKRGNK